MSFWDNKKILVTGGAGFLGSFIVEKLKERGVNGENIRIPRSRDIDLRKWENCVEVVKDIDIVIHLAAKVGGIGYNQKYPATLFYDNAIMGIQMMEAARQEGVEKYNREDIAAGFEGILEELIGMHNNVRIRSSQK